MARFVFHLDGVLRQRKHVEEQRQRELAAAQSELTVLQQQLGAMDQSLADSLADARQNHLIGTINIHFLTAHRRYLLAMQRKAMSLAQQIGGAQKKVDEARRVLLEAARQRKIIETLRDRRQAEWAAGIQRKEAGDLDEIGTQIGHRLALERMASPQFGSPGEEFMP